MHGLVVQVTRARVCDTEALYRRVLNDELALAADVFDEEPLPLSSPLLGPPQRGAYATRRGPHERRQPRLRRRRDRPLPAALNQERSPLQGASSWTSSSS